jgi:hypothetical protein
VASVELHAQTLSKLFFASAGVIGRRRRDFVG